MRELLLDSLICPTCGHGVWDLKRRQSAGTGIVESGELVCATCGACYEVCDGILDLIPYPDESILRERAGWEKFLEGASEELQDAWILSLPRVDDKVSSSTDTILHWKRQADNYSHLLDMLDLSGEERVLELGAGRCWASAHLSRMGCDVVAVDVVRAKRAGGLETGDVYLERGTPYFDRVVASMETLPFRPATFDLVLSVASIHHSPLLVSVVAEAARCLRPGGRLSLTSEPCVRVFSEKRVHNAETEAGINEHAYNILDYRRAFREAHLAPRFDLPGALLTMLEEHQEAPGTDGLRSWLYGLIRRMWHRPTLRRALRSQPANLVGLLFFEYGLTAVARKRTRTKEQ